MWDTERPVPDQGEIHWVHDTVGGQRPTIVVSRAELNRGKYFVGVPLTTSRLANRKTLPSCVFLPKGACGVPKACIAQADAITLLLRSDIVEVESRIGRLSEPLMNELIATIGYVLDADCSRGPRGKVGTTGT